jgi:DNA-binding NtrC family response regulator
MRVMLAEDRSSLRQALSETLRRAGFEVSEAADGRAAMELVEAGGYDLALLDLKMPVMSGLDLLKASRTRWPLTPAILLTAYGSVEVAVEAMKVGAADFLPKPVDPEHLLAVVRRTLEAGRDTRLKEVLATDLSRSPAFQEIVGESPALKLAQEAAAKIAATDTTCLLLGETGSGKELFARAIHHASPRAKEPFVAVNCAAIPGTLLENELFGHEKGAYTGAHETRIGRFEFAQHGTIFLDEIGEMSAELQAKLLRVIEEKAFTRVGGVRLVSVDVRILCATNRDLEAMIAERTFRQDLYYRLSAFPIRIPSLRERREDIPALAARFVAHFRRELGRPELKLAPEAEAFLTAQAWPGNVRELMNRVERAAILAGAGGRMGVDLFAAQGTAPALAPPNLLFAGEDDPEAWLEAEGRWRAREVLRRCKGDRKRAARLLEVSAARMAELVGENGPQT